MLSFRFARLSGIIALMLLAAGGVVFAQDAIWRRPRDLYASAAYEDALTVLNRLRFVRSSVRADRAPSNSTARSACWRSAAPLMREQAIEAVVVAEPSYHPSDTDVRRACARRSPTSGAGCCRHHPAEVRAVEVGVRQEGLRAGRRRLQAGACGAGRSRRRAGGQEPPLSDLQTLAVGFEELSASGCGRRLRRRPLRRRPPLSSPRRRTADAPARLRRRRSECGGAGARSTRRCRCIQAR